MKCLQCPHRVTAHKALTETHFCGFTGAQVATFQFVSVSTGDAGGPCCDGRDDPEVACPITLDRIMDEPNSRALAQPVVRLAMERGKADDLVGCYRGRHRVWIEQLLSES